MKIQLEIIAITQQLEYAIDELKQKKPDKILINDYLTESLFRIKKIYKLRNGTPTN